MSLQINLVTSHDLTVMIIFFSEITKIPLRDSEINKFDFLTLIKKISKDQLLKIYDKYGGEMT